MFEFFKILMLATGDFATKFGYQTTMVLLVSFFLCLIVKAIQKIATNHLKHIGDAIQLVDSKITSVGKEVGLLNKKLVK